MIHLDAFYLGLYKSGSPYDSNIVGMVLSALKTEYPEFFPATFQTGPDKHVKIEASEDFDYGLIPFDYWVEPDLSVRIPFVGANGVELVILDDRESKPIPSNVVLTWPDHRTLPERAVLEKIFCTLIQTCAPSYAHVNNIKVTFNDDFYERSFQVKEVEIPATLYWITWFSPNYMRTVPEEKLLKLKEMNGVQVNACAEGFIVSLLDEPFDEENPVHLQRRLEAENISGLTAIYASL